MNFNEYIKFDKDQVADRLFKYPSLLNALLTKKNKVSDDLKFESLLLAQEEAKLRILKRSKEKNLALTKKSSETGLKDFIIINTEIDKIRKNVLNIENELNIVSAKIEVLKHTRDILISFANDRREELRGTTRRKEKE